jgi:hypothetical protein
LRKIVVKVKIDLIRNECDCCGQTSVGRGKRKSRGKEEVNVKRK